MKPFLIVAFVFITHSVLSQKIEANAIINLDYKESVSIFDSPNGKVFKNLSHDFKNENFLVLNILDSKEDYFNVEIGLSISIDHYWKGWIKKANYIGTYLRNYSGELNLYSGPNHNSKVQSKIQKYNSAFFPILKVSGKWVYVNLTIENEIVEGWVQPDMQCANPYTNCN